MRKLLLLIFGALIALPAISQIPKSPTGYWIGEVTRIWYPKKITIKDSLTYKYMTYYNYDTAHVHFAGQDTFEVTVSFRKISGSTPKPPVVLPDIIASLDDNVTTTAQIYNPSTNAGDNIYIPTTGWTHFKGQTWNAQHFSNTASVVDIANAYVEVTCTCYKIEWYSEKRENHGIASIQLDSSPAVDVDLYAARTDNNSTKVYTTPTTMVQATHKLRVNFTGRKNAAATQTNIIHDRFVLYKKQ